MASESSTSSQVSHADVIAFADKRVNLKRDDASKYRKQAQGVRDKIEALIAENPDYGLVKTLVSGSLAKGTALSDLNDIDLVAYVKSDIAPQNEAKLLGWLAERLRKAYPQKDASDFEPKTHVVRVSFRGTGLDVDVGPVHYEGDPEDRGYLVDHHTGKRVLTSIPLHLKFIRSRKESHGKNYAQLVRLLKWWVRQRKQSDTSFRMKSFLTELLVAHIADGGAPLSDMPSSMEAFFRYVVTSGLEQRVAFYDYYAASKLPPPTSDAIEVFDPVNPENNVAAGYSTTDRANIVSAAEDALDALAAGRYAQKKGRAVESWRQILGPGFGR